ncbi:MAG: hypothetical protein NTX56_12120 [Proteobacteria bacterium]|nr:hypothetical protein [Pseudomonadota bacterium]
MTNDDPLYVRQLEVARDSAEIEIRVLEYELKRCHEIIAYQQNALNPTQMGEIVFSPATVRREYDRLLAALMEIVSIARPPWTPEVLIARKAVGIKEIAE